MIRFYVAVFHAECSMITENDLELCTEGQPVSTVFALKNAEQEKERIRRALGQANGNRSIAASLLEIGRSMLYRKMQDYGML
ncbi:helix-turn-helix domain-containing protein [Bacteroides ovatus]|uniref:helix-turn-helix domain-containing protein n=1 Tax=Bacteroides ovatus TaxID=28116 RepID=UPI00189A776A|nr:helix-turn-helix domain-containing protein [Bacteroides ovatus]MDC2608104.1 helix-turn-helix domain-containing protein [Bacteroides ovatus]